MLGCYPPSAKIAIRLKRQSKWVVGYLPPCPQLIFRLVQIFQNNMAVTFTVDANHVQTLTHKTCNYFFSNSGFKPLEACWSDLVSLPCLFCKEDMFYCCYLILYRVLRLLRPARRVSLLFILSPPRGCVLLMMAPGLWGKWCTVLNNMTIFTDFRSLAVPPILRYRNGS